MSTHNNMRQASRAGATNRHSLACLPVETSTKTTIDFEYDLDSDLEFSLPAQNYAARITLEHFPGDP